MTARDLERDSIRAFVASHVFEGRVLDYGCGKQPYRDLVERTAEYVPFDRTHFPANVSGENVGADVETHPTYLQPHQWDTILCTQIFQYVHDPADLLADFHHLLRNDGTLVLTYPTNWAEVEPEDLHRFTKAGMELMLQGEGFTIERHERRAEVEAAGMVFPLGYGVVARRP